MCRLSAVGIWRKSKVISVISKNIIKSCRLGKNWRVFLHWPDFQISCIILSRIESYVAMRSPYGAEWRCAAVPRLKPWVTCTQPFQGCPCPVVCCRVVAMAVCFVAESHSAVAVLVGWSQPHSGCVQLTCGFSRRSGVRQGFGIIDAAHSVGAQPPRG